MHSRSCLAAQQLKTKVFRLPVLGFRVGKSVLDKD